MIEARLIKWLRQSIEAYDPPCKTWIDQVQLKEERDYLLLQLAQLTDEDSWWSDHEWEWFLERCLDFLGAPK